MKLRFKGSDDAEVNEVFTAERIYPAQKSAWVPCDYGCAVWDDTGAEWYIDLQDPDFEVLS